MADQKARSGIKRGAGRRVRTSGSATNSMATFYVGPGANLPKGVKGYKLKVSEAASKALVKSPKRMKALLQAYGDAVSQSHKVGRPVSFRVEVDPDGESIHTTLEDLDAVPEPVAAEAGELNSELEAALANARERGRLRAAEILSGSDMLSADEFARLLGTSRVTVNAKRQNGLVLGLDGAKRGFRYPKWQLNAEGKPFTELADLHDLLGGPWGVYRFLVQNHGELGGLTGREALERGKIEATLEAAKSVGRDFR